MMGWKIKNQDLKMNGIYANSHRSHPYLWAPSMHYAFLKKKKGQDMFNFELLFLQDFHSRPSVKHVLEVLEWFYRLTEKILFFLPKKKNGFFTTLAEKQASQCLAPDCTFLTSGNMKTSPAVGIVQTVGKQVSFNQSIMFISPQS